MSREKFFSKWTLWLTIPLFLLPAAALVVWGGIAVADTGPVEIPSEALWASSRHADANSEAFIHWDEDDPPEVPTRCAKCHSTGGYLDFLGADGTEAGTVDNPAPIGTTVTCVACHNNATSALDSVTFPSGVEVTGLGDSARCMLCHQGRESSVSVDQKITDANVPDDDTVSSKLSFRNIHYFAAGATLLGGEALGGYQYAGKSYDARFAHVEGLETCTDCHDSHSLEVRVETCSTCHWEVTDGEDLKDIRVLGSTSDYDGDGDITKGIYDEIVGLQVILYEAIRAYAADNGAPIVYDSHLYPYWFNEGDGSRYATWTARLVKATYNLQVSIKDPGAFAHNGKYIIQLLYDSIEDLDPALVAGLNRDDAGHFAGSKEAWRHWDEDGKVRGSCAKCHTATGLPLFLEEKAEISQPISNGLLCSTCHDSLSEFTRYEAGAVEFPSGVELDTGDSNSNLCINCHQGRKSTVAVNDAIAGLDLDTVKSSIRFQNVHYYAAGATLFGTEAKGTYEYMGKTYNGRFPHVWTYDSCTECHDAHSLEVKVRSCAMCHTSGATPEDIRLSADDFDGDGNTSEGIAHEIETLAEALYAAMQAYSSVHGGLIVYDAHRYPYFFNDTGGSYKAFTPRLLQAAYNYQYILKDPGAFAHNGKYIIQVLYDSIESLGTQVTVDMTGMIRPDAENTSDACGDATHPYPKGDLNQDCRVTFADVALLCADWLKDNNP